MPIGAKRTMAFLAICCLSIGALTRSALAGSPLEGRVDAVVNSRGFEGGHWGLLVVDSGTGKVVFERNADRMFCPASVTKLFTCAGALIELGPDHRFKTPVVRRGELKDGTLKGDLILIARGDLCLGGRTGPEGTLLFEDNDHTYANGNPDASLVNADPLGGLTHLAREVYAAGIKEIKGDVLVDDRLFDQAPSSGSGPKRVTPIVVNDNVVDILVAPAAKPGDPARVRIVPETSAVEIDSRVETIAEGTASIEIHAVAPRRFTVRGRIPAGHKPVLKIYEAEDPAAFARSVFIETLRSRGVRVEASPLAENRVADLPSKAEVCGLPVVAEYTSPPFREYLKVILKVSHNLHASTLPMLVASRHGETSLSAALKREGEILGKLGVDARSISFGGGAGGSRSDLVTPRATVALLRAMASRPDFAAYDAALPVLGRDGTLAKAVSPESPAKGHVRAKTGTFWVDNALNGRPILISKALAGYLETASGQKLVFAFFVNNIPADAIGGSVTEVAAAAGRRLGRLCEVFYADTPESIEAPGTTVQEPAKADR